MSYLDRIRECNRHDLSRFRPFTVGRAHVGYVRDDVADALAPYDTVFHVGPRGVALDDGLTEFDQRTQYVDAVLRQISDRGLMSKWRDEPYAVTAGFGGRPLFVMERAAVPLFGVRAHGVHMNGYVRKAGHLHMWIGRRSHSKPTYPGMLDNMVAGGLPYGLTPKECLVKEADEEAGIGRTLASRAVAVGAITYCAETEEGLKPDVQYCYDLELPVDFRPTCRDGELEGFMLMPIEDVAALVRDTREFKFNCNLVVIDFLVRHGLIGPDDPDYVAIVQGLHQ